jgi:hypothetical protein
MLHVANIHKVHFAASDFIPEETGRPGKRRLRLGRDEIDGLLPTQRDISERFFLRESRRRKRLAFVATVTMEFAKLERFVTRGQIEIREE